MTARLVQGLLREAADSNPQRLAVIDEARSLTYLELEWASNRLANALIDCGVRRGDRVGLLLEKSLEAVIAIYGTMKAGAAYVPFDDLAPAARLSYIARDAGTRVLISTAGRASDVLGPGPTRDYLDTVIVAPESGTLGSSGDLDLGYRCVPWSALETYGDSPPLVESSEDDLAYILYTSGSTGDPKGVMLSHRNALTFVDWAADEIGLRPDDRVSSHAPFHFDLSVFDLFASARAACVTVLVPRAMSTFPAELSRFMSEMGITVWYSVPSILTLLVLRGGLERYSLDRLHTVLFAGEVFPVKYLARLMELLPHVRFCNLYGPTETNVCTWFEVPRAGEHLDTIPIGKPIRGVNVQIIDESGRPVEGAGPGELVVRGPSVMRGYWGDCERTRRALDFDSGEPVYRTGDIVRRDDNGQLLFVGRRDMQIKSRGYRIELGEVESAIQSHDQVVECAVVAVPDELVTNRLKAFVAGGKGLSVGALARWCGERLPHYMVPDEFELRDELPKSSTGKVDRRRLTQ